jgi:hypothetical protein
MPCQCRRVAPSKRNTTASSSLVGVANSRDAVAGHVLPRAVAMRLSPLLHVAARAMLADRELRDYICP